MYILAAFFIIPSFQITAQVSNVKLDNDVYTFLSNLSKKGIVNYNDLVKPLSRRYIAEKLVEAREKYKSLSNLQKDELSFYESEYGYEIGKLYLSKEYQLLNNNTAAQLINNKEQIIQDKGKEEKVRDLTDKSWEFEERKPVNKEKREVRKKNLLNRGSINGVYKSDVWKKGSKNINSKNINFVEYDEFNRWRFFNYKNENINLNVIPIAGYEIANWEKSNYQNVMVGLSFNGELGNFIGFNFELKQTRESPRVKNFLYNKFSSNTAIDLQLADAERLEYSTINVDIGVKWEWGSFTIGKNYLNWGYAENGNIVLSEKAPSFPYLRLDIKPTEWLSFNFLHAWLNSDVIDSNAVYSTWRVRGSFFPERKVYIPKFIAMHSFTVSPFKNLDFSFGESIVYADQLQIAYLIPIMFFDLTDEYLSRNDNYAGGSTQLFLALSSRNHVPNTHLYSSFHADELTPEGLFDPKTQYYKFAFTFGASTIDLPIDNLGVTLEYTKIYPGNYRHFIPTLTYESSSTLMGHWMGDNGDLFYGALDYTVFRGLKIKLWTQHIRKGTEALGNRAYKVQIPQPGFLFTDKISDRKNYSYYGIGLTYEILHDVWVKGHFQYIDYEQKISENKFRTTLNRDIAFSFGYGI